jgi:hypothetical protein
LDNSLHQRGQRFATLTKAADDRAHYFPRRDGFFFLYLYTMEKVKEFLGKYGQGIACSAVTAGLVSASLPTALFFGLFTAVALFVVSAVVDSF